MLCSHHHDSPCLTAARLQVAQDLAQVAAGLHKSPTYPSPTTSQPLQPPPSPARLASPTRVPQLHTTITLSETHTPATKQPGSYSLHDPSQDVNAICMAAAPHPVATPPRDGGLAGSHIDQEPIAALVLAGVSSKDIIGGTGVSTAVQARATEPLIMASALSPQPSHRLRPVATAPSSLKSAVSGAHLRASRPKFDRLVFNKRLTSHASLIHSRIAANTDLASARVALRKEVVG
ncbi:hypothetical protein QJQ45_009681 [Haematococcus lacustris]|nr:hypothetical protein QJQ45_009681 [Haematococcus lacustris]